MSEVTPVAYVHFVNKRKYPTQLKVARCPHCDKPHFHGSGGSEGPDFGHRVAHCGGALGYELKLT